MNFSILAALRKYLSVKQSQPGHIRIKFSMGIMKDAEALKLAQSPPEMPAAVTDVQLNLFSRTLSIEYDEAIILPALLEELITTESDTRASEILKDLHEVVYV